MAHALALAARGRYTTFPNPRVGCVIVNAGRVVGEGWHERAGEPHAEVHALREAGERAAGADAYVTLEPCSHHGRTPPCAEALAAARIGRVFVAILDPNPLVSGRGVARLRDAGIEVRVGLLEAEARQLNRGFLSRMERGRPFVTLKVAASLDGRTAMASGESKWITGEAARADVHRLRAEAGAVLTSSATVLADDPALTVRIPLETWAGRNGAQPGIPSRQPDRIVLDRQGRVPASAAVWRPGARRLRVGGPDLAPIRNVESLSVESGGELLSLHEALHALGAVGLNSLLVECGPRLAGALLGEGLVDEWIVYLAPSLLGDDARPLARLPGITALEQRLRWRFDDLSLVGTDLRLVLTPELPRDG